MPCEEAFPALREEPLTPPMKNNKEMPKNMNNIFTTVALLSALGLFHASPAVAQPMAPLQLQYAVSTSELTGPGRRHSIHYFPRAADALGRQGFVRIINNSASDGTVTIRAIDDGGTAADELTLSLEANEAVQFNSDDLEDGNAGKGLSGSAGRPTVGDWRLELTTGLDIEVLSFIRTKQDGFLTAMHESVVRDGRLHRVLTFNPASNYRQVSLLRIVNPGEADTEVRISGRDDGGRVLGDGAH